MRTPERTDQDFTPEQFILHLARSNRLGRLATWSLGMSIVASAYNGITETKLPWTIAAFAKGEVHATQIIYSKDPTSLEDCGAVEVGDECAERNWRAIPIHRKGRDGIPITLLPGYVPQLPRRKKANQIELIE